MLAYRDYTIVNVEVTAVINRGIEIPLLLYRDRGDVMCSKCERCFLDKGTKLYCCGFWSSEDELVAIDSVPSESFNKDGTCKFKESHIERKYVIVSNRHTGISGSLLFWGKRTADNEKRSFGGYTSNFNSCEIYTLEDIDNSDYKFPVYGRDLNHDNYRQFEDFAIEVRRLERLGHRPMLIYYR